MIGVYLKVRFLCSQSCSLTFITCTLFILVKITGSCLKCLSPQPPLAQRVFSSLQAQIRHLSMNALLISSTGCNLIFLSFGFSGAYLFCFFIAGYLKPLNPTPSITALDFKFLWAGNLLVYVNPFGSLSPQCFTYRKYSIKC